MKKRSVKAKAVLAVVTSVVLSTCCVLALPAHIAHATSVDELQAKVDEAAMAYDEATAKVNDLQAKIDEANGEYNKYVNSMQIYNEHYGNFVRWFAGLYEPAQGYMSEEEPTHGII